MRGEVVPVWGGRREQEVEAKVRKSSVMLFLMR